MSVQRVPHAGARRDQARARLRTLTNGALLAATGATVGIAVVVAHEHPGKSVGTSSAGSTTSGQSTGSTGSTGSSDDTGNSGTSTSGNTGNSGSSLVAPSITSQSPAATSGGSAHR